MNREAVADWIRTLDIGARGPLTFQRIGAGQSNLTYAVEDADGRSWIARRAPFGELAASAHDVVREHRILSALQTTDVPTPTVHGLCEDAAVTEAPLMLMERIEGTVIESVAVAESVSPPTRRALASSAVRALGRVHAVDLERTGLASLASHAPFAPRQLRRWRRQWESTRTRDLPLVDEVADLLTSAVPEQRETVLVHGDFHLLNLVLDVERGTVAAVLDWELSTLGDPLADLGGMLAYWPHADDVTPIGMLAPTLPGFPRREEVVAQYARVTGRDTEAVWFWYALGLWKLAIIAEGVYRRGLDDARNRSVDGTIDPGIVDQLAERARSVVRQASR